MLHWVSSAQISRTCLCVCKMRSPNISACYLFSYLVRCRVCDRCETSFNLSFFIDNSAVATFPTSLGSHDFVRSGIGVSNFRLLLMGIAKVTYDRWTSTTFLNCSNLFWIPLSLCSAQSIRWTIDLVLKSMYAAVLLSIWFVKGGCTHSAALQIANHVSYTYLRS